MPFQRCDALEFWYEHMGCHLMAAVPAHVVDTHGDGARCPRCGSSRRPVHAFRAGAESVAVPVVACGACYSLIRSYPRPGRPKPGRFNPKNVALVAPGRSVLLADIDARLPFATAPETTGRTAFLAALLTSPPPPPFMVVAFGQSPAIQGGLRICLDDDSVEFGGAESMHVSRTELALVERRLRESGLAWRQAAALLKARTAIFAAPAHRRAPLLVAYEKEIAKLHNAGAPAVLDGLPVRGTDLYRVMCWLNRSEDGEDTRDAS